MSSSIPPANVPVDGQSEPVAGPKGKKAPKTRKAVWGFMKFIGRP